MHYIRTLKYRLPLLLGIMLFKLKGNPRKSQIFKQTEIIKSFIQHKSLSLSGNQ